MQYGNSVKDVRLLEDYKVRVVFSDDYADDVDLAPLFQSRQGPLLQSLKDPALFGQVYVDGDSIAWPNGYDICPDVLRFYCEQGRVTSKEEMNAYFNPAPTFVLNDKPSK